MKWNNKKNKVYLIPNTDIHKQKELALIYYMP
jgi:hypothetical protein